MLLNSGVPGIHKTPGCEVELAIPVGLRELAEVAQAEAVARFMQDNCLHINRVIGIDSPIKIIVVIDLSKSNVVFAIPVYIGELVILIDPPESEGDSEYFSAGARAKRQLKKTTR